MFAIAISILIYMKNNLAKWYSVADYYINTTYEDNYPTTNLEATSCGTVVITYKTGGSIESVYEDNVVEKGDIEAVAELIVNNKTCKVFTSNFDAKQMIDCYMKLYEM